MDSGGWQTGCSVRTQPSGHGPDNCLMQLSRFGLVILCIKILLYKEVVLYTALQILLEHVQGAGATVEPVKVTEVDTDLEELRRSIDKL